MHDDGELVERILHIEDMKEELRELSDDQVVMGKGDHDLPLEVEEKFLEHVLAFEHAAMISHRALLERDGIVVPAPEELSDEELPRKLEEVIQALAQRRIFLTFTNHLSDRALYTKLCEEVLDGEGPDLPYEAEVNCHIDLLECGDEEDAALWLRYYADEIDRARWAQDFSEEVPPHQDPPYDRDRHLPTPPLPPNPYDDPEVTHAWITECHARLLQDLAEEGLRHGAVHEDPLSYAPGLACVWSVLDPDVPDLVGWWAINGDLPTTYLPAADLPDPRAFLRAGQSELAADGGGLGGPGRDRRRGGRAVSCPAAAETSV